MPLLSEKPARWSDPDVLRTLIALALLACVAATLAAMPHDDAIRDMVVTGGSGRSLFWRSLSRLGKSDWMLIPSGLAAIVLYVMRPRLAAIGCRDVGGSLRVAFFFFVAVAATGIVAVIFKYGLGYPRPSVVGAYGPHFFALDPDYASFPSGHSTSAAAMAMAGTLLWPPAGLLLWPLALMIGLSRIMVNGHHLSDVIAGLSLGAWGTVLIARAFARRGVLFGVGASGWPTVDRRDIDALISDVGALFGRAWAAAHAADGETPTDAAPALLRPATGLDADMSLILTSEPGVVSVVIPAKDEADNLAVIVPEILTAMAGRSFEVIVVDDGSTDATASLMSRMMDDGMPVRHIRHEQPCGQSAAVRSGLYAARGEIIATIDGDGQNDPAYIPKLVDGLLAAGPACGIAAGQRLKRTDGFIKKCASRFANWLRNAILRDETRDTGCGLKAIRRELFLKLPFFHGWHRYLPALVLREGFGVTHIDVVDRSRMHGRSNYGIFDRGLQGILDLFGVWWLKRRIKRLPVVSEVTRDKAGA